ATGLEILAGFYRDVAAAQVGAPVRNTDIPVSQLTQVMPGEAMRHADRVLETIESLEANQRPQLALAALFAELGGDA
ncbi:MAG: DNA polymerase III subunit delta', partial [Acidimicrobiia bacterium]|nr:DNA polymerase III subunit delta' [Acidimicrobiia bacterium]